MTATRNPSRDKRRVINEEETERLRARVPDDPIPLPIGHLACEACGVATPVDVFAAVAEPSRAKPAPFTLCDDCQALRQQAQEFADAHPVLKHRLGIPLALDRIEWTLRALAVIGRTTKTSDVPVMLTRLYGLGHNVGFRSRTERVRRECSPYPWAHVPLSDRAAIRAAYGAALRDRLALSAGPVAIACPSTACLMCGVSTITRSAIEVSRRGSVGATQLALWRAVTIDRTALGGAPCPKRVEGHVCPACTDAIDQVGGVGRRARTRAVVAYLSRSSPQTAERLRSMSAGDFPPTLPAWGARTEPRVPNESPWDHLAGLLGRS